MINRIMLIASTYIPERKFPETSETYPINQVESVAPIVPAIKNGVERRFASGPKVFENRETFAGNTHEVPNPAMIEPTLSPTTVSAEITTNIPPNIVNRPSSSILLSFKNLNKIGAAPRPATKKTK